MSIIFNNEMQSKFTVETKKLYLIYFRYETVEIWSGNSHLNFYANLYHCLWWYV